MKPEIQQQAGNLAGQFTVKGIAGPDGTVIGKLILDSGDGVTINFPAKSLPFLVRDEMVFVTMTVVRTVAIAPAGSPIIQPTH